MSQDGPAASAPPMPEPTAADQRSAREDEIMRGLLERIDGSEALSQRDLARELGIALGMTNAYVKRCVKKGLIKVAEVPARRYRYYLTPMGFAEKSRLTAEYFSSAFGLFRKARGSFDRLFDELDRQGVETVALCGVDDMTEVAMLCSLNAKTRVIGIWDPAGGRREMRGIPAIGLDEAVKAERLILSLSRDAGAVYDRLAARVPATRIAVPDILSVGGHRKSRAR